MTTLTETRTRAASSSGKRSATIAAAPSSWPPATCNPAPFWARSPPPANTPPTIPPPANGTQTAAAVLWDSVDASGGDTNAVVLIRGPAIVNQYEISIPGTPTAPQIAAAHAALLTLGILVR